MWKIREDILGHYVNATSNRTFQDMVDRLNYLEEREEVKIPEPIMDKPDDDINFQKMIGRYDVTYKCKVCDNEIFIDNYCNHCGQKIR